MNPVSAPRSKTTFRLAAGGVLLVGTTGGAGLLASVAGAQQAPDGGSGLGSAPLAPASLSPVAAFTVSNTNDSGPGSLRQAVIDANGAAGADTITFNPSVTGTITLSSGEIPITDSVTITGPGMSVLGVSGNNASRIFNVSGTADVAVIGLGLANGNAGNGSAIFASQTGSITLDHVDVHANTATNGWGALYFRNTGAVTITNSSVRDNLAPNGNSVSAVYTRRNTTSVTITGTSITGNVGTGSVLNLYSVGDITITDSTIADNSTTNTTSNSPTMFLYSSAGNTIVRNTTVSGNSGAGSTDRPLIFSVGPLKVQNSTITANTGVDAFRLVSNSEFAQSTVTGNSGHEVRFGPFAGGSTRTLTVSGSIISDNTSDDFITTNSGVLTVNSDRSIIGGAGANVNVVDAGGTLRNVADLKLGTLANNGGPTKTLLPLTGSPAIDAGPDPVVTFPGNQFDQRGVGYPRVVGGRVDIGAVEVQPVPPAPEPTPSDPVIPTFTG